MVQTADEQSKVNNKPKTISYEDAGRQFCKLLGVFVEPSTFARLEGKVGSPDAMASLVPGESRLKAYSGAFVEEGEYGGYHDVTIFLEVPVRSESRGRVFRGVLSQYSFANYEKDKPTKRVIVERTLAEIFDMVANPDKYPQDEDILSSMGY